MIGVFGPLALERKPKKKLLDLFCKAGGATKGYKDAGFYVVGVDIEAQPHYIGDEFVQSDALEYLAAHGHEYDAIHASPPCQRFSRSTPKKYRDNHPDLIGPTRDLLKKIGKPYVIENVPDARHLLINPIYLCGTAFGRNIERHRYFEIEGPEILMVPQCQHIGYPVLITGTTRRKSGRFEYTAPQCREASGLYWMTRKEMDEAILPDYTRWIGQHLMAYLNRAS